jgi:hypothetical protein
MGKLFQWTCFVSVSFLFCRMVVGSKWHSVNGCLFNVCVRCLGCALGLCDFAILFSS